MAAPILLVLAGGQGSRFGGLKQLHPVGPQGETLLDYALFDARRAGFARVVFVIGAAFADTFRDRVASRHAGVMPVDCVVQRLDDLPAGFQAPAARSKPWGTLHAVWSARAVLDAPFAVVNADDFYGRDAYRRMAEFLSGLTRTDAPVQRCAMVAYALARTLSGSGGVNRGICAVEDGRLRGVVEHTGIVALPQGAGCEGQGPDGQRRMLPEDAVASMNLWGFEPAVLPAMAQFLQAFLVAGGPAPTAECYLPAFVNQAIAQQRLVCEVLPTDAAWFGLTYLEDVPACQSALRALVELRDYPNALAAAAAGTGPNCAAK